MPLCLPVMMRMTIWWRKTGSRSGRTALSLSPDSTSETWHRTAAILLTQSLTFLGECFPLYSDSQSIYYNSQKLEIWYHDYAFKLLTVCEIYFFRECRGIVGQALFLVASYSPCLHFALPTLVDSCCVKKNHLKLCVHVLPGDNSQLMNWQFSHSINEFTQLFNTSILWLQE